nr:fasciclin-like arabinogalactan protein 21 [Ipomoea batatas]
MASAMRAPIFFVLILQLLFSSSGTAALITSSLLADVFSKLGFRELAAVTAAANISIAAAAVTVFVNGAEVTKADLFNNGRVIIHGLQGFVSHLSDLSCEVDRQTTLVVSPAPAAGVFAAHRMLKQAMMQLRASGYSIVALAMRVKYTELSELTTMTVFALDDADIFAAGEGHAYVADLGLHIVPNRLLTASELIALPPGTVLPTMERGRSLVVTTAGGGGAFTPMRINFVKIKNLDLVTNERIVVHGLSAPFRALVRIKRMVGDSA